MFRNDEEFKQRSVGKFRRQLLQRDVIYGNISEALSVTLKPCNFVSTLTLYSFRNAFFHNLKLKTRRISHL